MKSRVGKDGALRVDVPSELAGTEVEIIITPKATPGPSTSPAGWSPEFFEVVVGGWMGNSLVREPQGEYETRRVS